MEMTFNSLLRDQGKTNRGNQTWTELSILSCEISYFYAPRPKFWFFFQFSLARSGAVRIGCGWVSFRAFQFSLARSVLNFIFYPNNLSFHFQFSLARSDVYTVVRADVMYILSILSCEISSTYLLTYSIMSWAFNSLLRDQIYITLQPINTRRVTFNSLLRDQLSGGVLSLLLLKRFQFSLARSAQIAVHQVSSSQLSILSCEISPDFYSQLGKPYSNLSILSCEISLKKTQPHL